MQKNIKPLDTPNYKQWKENLKEFIKKELVPRILPGTDPKIDKYRQIMISDKAMAIWRVAFTHPSYDSRTDHNYDVYEYKGDKLLDYALGVYMKKKYPNANQDTLTNFKTSFASRDPLAEIAIKTKLIDHVLTVKILNETKEISDIFESVVGAITQIGDDLIAAGVGFTFAFNYITSIYNWYDDLVIETGETSLVNQVMQGYYDALGWKKFNESKQDLESWNPETKTLTLYLNETAIRMLNKLGHEPDNIESYRGAQRAILAQGTGDSEKDAQDPTYRKALRNLQTVYGISPKDAKVTKIKVYLNTLIKNGIISEKEADEIAAGVIEQNERYGVDWNNQKVMDTKNGRMYVLNGYQTEQMQTLQLYRIIFKSEEDAALARLRLYQLYAKNGKIKDGSYYYYQ